jgi:ABC-type transporter lipoprotein component MlaA
MNATNMIAKTLDFVPGSRHFLLFFCVLSLFGCATGPNANPKDPLEPLNRGISRFNDVVDNSALKPVATAYEKVTPSPVRTGVRNFFGNLQDVWTTVNTALQLRGQDTAEMTMRVAVNTVFGLGGLLDIASEARLDKRREDFGSTLGRWGVGSGPYLVMPFFGPSTVRDTIAFPVDSYGATYCPRLAMCLHATRLWLCALWIPAPICWAPAAWLMMWRWTNTVSFEMPTCSAAHQAFMATRRLKKRLKKKPISQN